MIETRPFWVASYPKSGSTWVRCLMASLEKGGAAPDLAVLGHHSPRSADRRWLEAVTGVETSDLTPAELTDLRASAHRAIAVGDPVAPLAARPVRYLKIHDAYDPVLFPAGSTAGAVYIVRDPRDVAPSWADQMQISLDAAIERMAQSDSSLGRTVRRLGPLVEERLGSWSTHVASWLDRFGGPLLILRYEDLLSDPIAQVTRLAGFLGLPADATTVQAATRSCRFAALREREERNGFIEKVDHQQRFFRQGRSGTWQEHLSPVQAVSVVSSHREMMSRLGYSVP